MAEPYIVTLSAIPKGNVYQSVVEIDGVTIASMEAFPSIQEAIEQSAWKVLKQPERLSLMLDRDQHGPTSASGDTNPVI